MHFVGLQYGRWQVQDLELGILKSLVSMVWGIIMEVQFSHCFMNLFGCKPSAG
jgi:hypothetical protein